MVKRIIFNGKRLRVANISMLQRHGERHHIRNEATQHLVGLTSRGKVESHKVGERLDKNYKLKTFTSPSIRTRQTRFHLVKGHKAKGGFAAPIKRSKGVGVRQELLVKGTNNIFLDFKFLKKESARLKNDWNKLTKNWFDGKYSAKQVVPAKKVAQNIIRKQLVLGKRATRAGRKGWLIISISHDTQIMAVLNELLGKNPYSLGFKLPAFNEGLNIYHTTKERDILEFEGKRFDVTKKLAKFMKNSKFT